MPMISLPTLALTGVVVAAAMTLVSPASSAADGATCHGEAATIVGTEGPDDLTGTDGRDVIVGLGGDDHIESLDGDDVVCGGAGDDVIDLGSGEDLAVWAPGDGLDTVVGGPAHRDRLDITGTPGDDVFTARTTRDDVGRGLAMTVAGEGAVLHGVEGVTAWMGDGADVLRAARTRLSPTQFYDVHPDAETSDGAADVIEWAGSRHADEVFLDAVSWEGSAATIQARSPRGARYLTLVSSEPQDTMVLDGRAGPDSLAYLAAAGSNHVEVTGRTAREVRITDRDVHSDPEARLRVYRLVSPYRLDVFTQTGADEIDLTGLRSSYPVRVVGGAAADVFQGSPGPDRFVGGGDDDVAHGGGGNDVLLGGWGDDRLFGGAGDDRLNGGRNRDSCHGGPGHDRLRNCE